MSSCTSTSCSSPRPEHTPAGYRLRTYREGDAPALAAITAAAIEAVGRRRYSPEQVAAWAARHPGPERFVERIAQGHLIWIIANARDEPVAYALLEPEAEDGGHLDMLYCHPAHTRNGLADRLLSQAEQHARGLNLARLYTEASDLARPAFERAGYRVTHRRDFAIEHAGKRVPIHNHAMEKVLA